MQDELKPQNQHEQVLYYLYNWTNFSLMDLINDSMFFKFQTRLSDLEHRHGTLATRESISFTNRFGHTNSYYIYRAIDKNRILELYKSMKNEALKKINVKETYV